MTNPHKGNGEVPFKVGEDEYTMSYSADALAELEDALDKPINEIGEAMQNPKTMRIGMVRTVFWAGLLDHHGFDLPAARLIFKRMSVTNVVDIIGRAFTLAFPDVSKDAAPDPQVPDGAAAPGTGPTS